MDFHIHLQKDNLHHAYLFEGDKEVIFPNLLLYLESLGIKKDGNPDFYEMTYGTFKMADAMYLRSFTDKKSVNDNKKVFLISLDTILLEAQNTLLKLFEEPIPDTHFFIIAPDSNAFLPTFISRFYLIKDRDNERKEYQKAKEFISMNRTTRIAFIQELLKSEGEDESDEDEEEIVVAVNTKSAKAQSFLNALEYELHQKFFVDKKVTSNASFLEHLFKVRMYLRQPGASAKNLLESLALAIPEKI